MFSLSLMLLFSTVCWDEFLMSFFNSRKTLAAITLMITFCPFPQFFPYWGLVRHLLEFLTLYFMYFNSIDMVSNLRWFAQACLPVYTVQLCLLCPCCRFKFNDIFHLKFLYLSREWEIKSETERKYVQKTYLLKNCYRKYVRTLKP